MNDYPVVSVEQPVITVDDLQAGADTSYVGTAKPWVDVTCSEHGLIDGFYLTAHPFVEQIDAAWARARRVAKRHAADAHDDLVDRVGWT